MKSRGGRRLGGGAAAGGKWSGAAALALLSFSACQQATSQEENTIATRAQGLQTAPASLVSESLGAPPGVTLLPGLAAVSWGPGRLDVFARASNGAVWQRWFNGSWQPWASLGFSAGSTLTASSWAPGRLDLFFRDPAANRLHHRYFDGSWGDGGLIGTSTIPATAPAAASWALGRIDVLMQGSSFELKHIWYDHGWIADWVTESGTAGDVGSAPSAVSWAPNRLDVFWASTANNRLQHWWYDGGLHPLDPLGGEALGSVPTSASRGAGLLDVFFLSATNANTLTRTLYDRAWGGEDFTLGSANSPAVASWGPGRLDLFYQDSSNALQHTIVPGPPMLTHHNDNGRTGANLHELELNVDTIPSKLGRLFDIHVDGNVYAQPLFVPTLDLRSQGFGILNVLYIATANNSLYLADADGGGILRQLSLGNPIPVPFADFTAGSGGSPCLYNMLPEVGITSTPVIDSSRGTIYFVSVRADNSLVPEPIPSGCPPLKTTSTFRYHVYLHAVDMRTLSEKPGSPVEVVGNSGGFTFDARRQLQRPGLLLSGGVVYLGFGSYTDTTPYTGWVMGYDAGTLTQRFTWITTPNGGMGGIWQAGQGLAADSAGSLYFLTGNGASNPSANQFATAAVKLSSSLQLQSYFMPWNQGFINGTDLDLGSSGIMLVPGTNYALGGGKESILYMMDRTNLGGFNAAADQVVYEDQVTFGNPSCGGPQHSNIHEAPVFWQSPAGPRFYVWGEEDFMRAYALSASSFSFAGSSTTARAACGMPGGFMSISANGSVSGTGIVWGTVPTQDSLAAVVPGRVWALNAETEAELWSADIGVNDPTERFAKNNPPTVANGKVYVAAFGPASNAAGVTNSSYSGKVIVYGLTQK